MTEYYETRQHLPYRGHDLAADEHAMRRSMTRGSQQTQGSASATQSTASWVQQNQLYPPGPPPETSRFSPDLTPLRRPRPLPDPGPQLYQSRSAFQYVSTQEQEEEDYMTAERHPTPMPEPRFMYQHPEETRRGGGGGAGEDFNPNVIPLPTSPVPGSPMSPPQGRAGRSFVGGFFNGIKRLPKLVLKPSFNDEKRRLKHKGTFNTEFTEGTSTATAATGMTRGNTLPRYLSNPSIGPSNPQFAHRLSMAVANGATPATVYHLRTNTAGPQFPIVTITPASGSEGIAEEEQARFYDAPPGGEMRLSAYGEREETERRDERQRRLNDRTTVMVYNTDSQVPTRTQSVAAAAPLPPPMRQPTPGPRVSYQAQLPTRANAQAGQAEAGPSTGPGPGNAATSTAQTGGILNPTTTQPSAATRMMGSTTPRGGGDISSPRSGPSSSSYTISAVPSFYDPSFASDLTPIEKFFKGLYNLPWVAQERVTIDYRPGESSRARAKVKAMTMGKPKAMASWYRAIMSRSRRGSREIDLFSSGSSMSPRTTTSYGNTLSPLGSPLSREPGRVPNAGVQQHQHQNYEYNYDNEYAPKSKRRHHRRKKRHRGTWETGRSAGEDSAYVQQQQGNTSPIVPTLYPYAYPGYPVYAPPYGAPPGAMPMPHTVPRGPRKHRSKNGMHTSGYRYHATAGGAPYQPMAMPPPMQMGGLPPPPVYFIAPSPPQSGSGMGLGDPGGSGGGTGRNNDQQTQRQGQGQMSQVPGALQVSPVIMHFVPGAFGNQQNMGMGMNVNMNNMNPRNPAMLSPPLTPQRQAAYDS